MPYSKIIPPKTILTATWALSIYFLLLFLNGTYCFINSGSVLGALAELLTIPFILAIVFIAIYSGVCVFRRKENRWMLAVSLIVSAIIIVMFLVVK